MSKSESLPMTLPEIEPNSFYAMGSGDIIVILVFTFLPKVSFDVSI